MTKRDRPALCVLAIAMALPTPVFAQDAAETAIILSGTGNQAKAARSLGDAVNNSINSATASVQASNPRRSQSVSPPRTRRNAPSDVSVIGTGDALEGTDASTYQTNSGATIKVSGGFRPSVTTTCTENCGTADPE